MKEKCSFVQLKIKLELALIEIYNTDNKIGEKI